MSAIGFKSRFRHSADRCVFGGWFAAPLRRGWLVCAVLQYVLTTAAIATPPFFRGLGFLPGGSVSGAFAVTPNGSVVVGYSGTPIGDRAFRWSLQSGMQSLGILPGSVDSRGVGVSADGSMVAGYASSLTGYRAFRWANGVMTDIGTLPGGDYAIAGAISDDGSVIVGYSKFAGPTGVAFRAFRWTEAGGMANLDTLPGGSFSFGQGVSGNGAVAIGVGDSEESFDFRAVRWSNAEGVTNLGTLPDGNYTVAFGVNTDGSAVVGYGRCGAEKCAFRWTSAGGLESLGAFPDADVTIARSVSADGSVVVGSSEAPSADRAFLWTKALGLVDLNTYLMARGIDLNGWTLTAAYAVSADGLTIVGVGIHSGKQEAWVAFLGVGQELSAIEQLGKSIMSDASLSSPAGQSCLSCHSPATGFSNPISELNAHGAVHPGAVSSRFAMRKPPTVAYSGESPPLHLEGGTWVGGVFFDGHAPGWTLGDPLAEQALRPFVGELEQNNPSEESVVSKVARSNYASIFRDVWGADSLPSDGGEGVALAYERIARSIAAYERSREVNPFNSKYDRFLAGRTNLTPQELLGLSLYEGIAGCAACHPSQPGPSGEPPLFTDFTFDNIGIPRNEENPFYGMPPGFNPDGEEFVDLGLGGFLAEVGFPSGVFGPAVGKQKVPTLRNVDRRPDGDFVKAYGHNGFFKSLEDVVHFYNTRDVEAWPPPEVPQNVNIVELGNLHLTHDDELAIVAFLKTLTDEEAAPVLCSSDFDRNGFVNGDDTDAYVLAFTEGNITSDFDRDGFVTGLDFDLFILAFEEGC